MTGTDIVPSHYLYNTIEYTHAYTTQIDKITSSTLTLYTV